MQDPSSADGEFPPELVAQLAQHFYGFHLPPQRASAIAGELIPMLQCIRAAEAVAPALGADESFRWVLLGRA